MNVQRVLLKCVTTPVHDKPVSLTSESQGWQEDFEHNSGWTSVWRPCWGAGRASCWVTVRRTVREQYAPVLHNGLLSLTVGKYLAGRRMWSTPAAGRA